jgi:hypothetical protein
MRMVQLLVGTAPLQHLGGGGGNGTGPGLGDSKGAENPEGNGGLPASTTPGAMEGVNFGDGSRASKDARESSARRRREQERARKERGRDVQGARARRQTTLIASTLPSSPP